MNLRDYITPLICGCFTLLVALIFSSQIQKVLQINNFSNEFFTFSSLLFGLVLTSYSILFGIIPSTKKGFRKSDTMKDINSYFKVCLISLLLSVILSLVYSFILNYLTFTIILVFIGIDVGFFGYIIFLINDIFEFVAQEEV